MCAPNSNVVSSRIDARQRASQDMSAPPIQLTCPLHTSILDGGHCGTPASSRSVMTARNSSRPIARVFRATAAPGCRDELLQRFHSSSAALVNSKTGCLKYRILEPVDASAPEVVFESIWRDLDSVKLAFGDAWQQSHLPEGYSALMTDYSVHHFLVSEGSTTK
jgi:quinol monooxygenase YgiN